ncbi:4-hydroxy-2-oxoheptanedioate aldolase [Rhodoferax sp.]|uniref:4-hydroxy-2-oxoheptanedioate aldolase n=1 Tax=Rhodoferax sp. TaxID=50421 RepID=UPI002ACE6172|nr:4-hydroxy-2-oxoheptanedioate aldolase [Rhodoferax sp.]MDZ7920524.1 4-hydroxy-2-oxoheptanedioate aldolase [Rhodoferax sp.]
MALPLPINTFKQALYAGQQLIGCWVGFAHANVAEALAGCGFDWLLLDGEHAPNDPRTVLDQLRAVAAYPVQAVVRPVVGDVALVKQYLDVGAQTLLIPMVDTPEHAVLMVGATRYAPEGIRGMGAALARASRWNQIPDYIHHANGQMCLLVQAETTLAIRNLASIAAVDGVDGVFFGPADLSASMGYRGQANHPEVQKAILDGIATVRSAGKAAGILMADKAQAQTYLDAGAQFVAVGVDTTLLVRAASDLAAHFKPTGTPQKGGTAGPQAAGSPY